MKNAGSEKSITVSYIKTHYDALGSYLHRPTLKQIKKGKISDPLKLRKKCNAVVDIIDKVLSSTVHNINFGVFAELDECSKCKQSIRHRIPHNMTDPVNARCFGCNAEYQITDTGYGKILWSPNMEEIKCPTESCDSAIALWADEIKPGTCWVCKKCNEKFIIQLSIVKDAISKDK